MSRILFGDLYSKWMENKNISIKGISVRSLYQNIKFKIKALN